MHEISCHVSPESAQRLEDYFCEYVRSSWSLLKIRDHDPFKLQGFFEDGGQAEAEYAELRAVFPELPADPEIREFDDQEWQDAYKAFIGPWSCRDLHWVPVWERGDYRVPDGHTAVYLDAGMAFGTGSHETTRLMARRLIDFRDARQPLSAARVIDAGCGSGILAISAAKLGFESIYAFDRDPEAIRVCRENIVSNDLPGTVVECTEAGLEDGLAGRRGDLVLANIQADVLKIHADDLLNATAPGGVLALSGILATEVNEVRAHYEPLAKEGFGTVVIETRLDGEWCDLVLFRR